MKVINRSAFHDYTIKERFEAGIKLMGSEVKSAKAGHISLKGAFAKIVSGEAFLINANISQYSFARQESYEPKRTRKLLLSKKQLISLQSKMDGTALTLVPLSMYTKKQLIKVEIGLGQGKKKYEKRETLKKRAQKRELERVFKGKVK